MFYLNMFFLELSTWDDLGHLPDTQGYSGLVFEPSTPTLLTLTFWDLGLGWA